MQSKVGNAVRAVNDFDLPPGDEPLACGAIAAVIERRPFSLGMKLPQQVEFSFGSEANDLEGTGHVRTMLPHVARPQSARARSAL